MNWSYETVVGYLESEMLELKIFDYSSLKYFAYFLYSKRTLEDPLTVAKERLYKRDQFDYKSYIDQKLLQFLRSLMESILFEIQERVYFLKPI